MIEDIQSLVRAMLRDDIATAVHQLWGALELGQKIGGGNVLVHALPPLPAEMV